MRVSCVAAIFKDSNRFGLFQTAMLFHFWSYNFMTCNPCLGCIIFYRCSYSIGHVHIGDFMGNVNFQFDFVVFSSFPISLWLPFRTNQPRAIPVILSRPQFVNIPFSSSIYCCILHFNRAISTVYYFTSFYILARHFYLWKWVMKNNETAKNEETKVN